MNQPENFRAFISIQPDPGISREIERLRRSLRVRMPDSAVKWTPSEHVHLTLRFLGDIETLRLPELESALRETASQFSPMKLAIENVGAFPNLSKPNIIWTGVGGEVAPLLVLQTAIERVAGAFSNHTEERPFHPHLTLARIRRTQFRQARAIGEYLKGVQVSRFGEWTATQFNLMQSDLQDKGPVYSCRASFKLGAEKAQSK